jgi:hypothetical protein
MQRNRHQISSIFAIPILIIASTFALGLVVHAQASDFVLTSTPSNLCVNPGVDAVSIISVQSIGTFAGTINLSDNVDPAIAGGPGSSPIPPSETLAAGQTVYFNLQLSTTTSTPISIYYVTVSGLSGGSFHQTTVQLTVSSGCSVGGSVLPLDRLSLLSPYLGMAILSGAVVAVIVVLVLYRRRTAQRPSP